MTAGDAGSVYNNALDLMLTFYHRHRKHPDRLIIPNNGCVNHLSTSLWYEIRQTDVQGIRRNEPFFCGMRIELACNKMDDMAVSLSTSNLYLTLTQLRHPSAP